MMLSSMTLPCLGRVIVDVHVQVRAAVA